MNQNKDNNSFLGKTSFVRKPKEKYKNKGYNNHKSIDEIKANFQGISKIKNKKMDKKSLASLGLIYLILFLGFGFVIIIFAMGLADIMNI